MDSSNFEGVTELNFSNETPLEVKLHPIQLFESKLRRRLLLSVLISNGPLRIIVHDCLKRKFDL